MLIVQGVFAFCRELPTRKWTITAFGRSACIDWKTRWLALWLFLGAVEWLAMAKAMEWTALGQLPSSTPELAPIQHSTVAQLAGLIVGFVMVGAMLISLPLFATFVLKHWHSLEYWRDEQEVNRALQQTMNWLTREASKYGISLADDQIPAPKLKEVPTLPEDEMKSSDSSPTIAPSRALQWRSEDRSNAQT
jgi:hypothetical protein